MKLIAQVPLADSAGIAFCSSHLPFKRVDTYPFADGSGADCLIIEDVSDPSRPEVIISTVLHPEKSSSTHKVIVTVCTVANTLRTGGLLLFGIPLTGNGLFNVSMYSAGRPSGRVNINLGGVIS